MISGLGRLSACAGQPSTRRTFGDCMEGFEAGRLQEDTSERRSSVKPPRPLNRDYGRATAARGDRPTHTQTIRGTAMQYADRYDDHRNRERVEAHDDNAAQLSHDEHASETRGHREGSDGWRRIEGEALEQVRAELDTEAALPFGHAVAWSFCRLGRTDGFSPVHRVGKPVLGTAVTCCGLTIPPAIRLVPLNPNLVRTLGQCHHCERLRAADESMQSGDRKGA